MARRSQRSEQHETLAKTTAQTLQATDPPTREALAETNPTALEAGLLHASDREHCRACAAGSLGLTVGLVSLPGAQQDRHAALHSTTWQSATHA